METASAEKKKNKKLPPWIDPLIRSTFFERCISHPQWYGSNRRCSAKNGCNFMCVDCCIPICSRCTQEEEEHRGHRAVQIRVSSFNNVVKVEDIKPFFDVAQVQTYLIYGFRVVCINKRQKATRRWPGSGGGGDAGSSTCKVCSRVLNAFCSIECKVCDYASASQKQNAEMSKATMTMMSGARKRARKAAPQRAHLGCTL
ncbi:hypothetical protein QOZ80_8AG0614910 [Eleusine coracana subsp. coracana]|nr:hypothetical protein QOZ80_8AG0614910 [Eleusine coracana subsp. coracana]